MIILLIINDRYHQDRIGMGKETTKIVREKTMPMIACQKQKAFHKGIQGSNTIQDRKDS